MAFYLFPTGLAPHLNRHSCPIAPGGEGGALWAGGCGESLPPSRREGLLSVLCAPELRLSRDCRGQDAALSPWGSPALEQDDTGSHSHLHHGGWFGLLPPSPGGRYQWGSVLRGLSQAPVVSQGPRARAVQVAREGALGNGCGDVGRVPGPAAGPASGSRPHCPLAGLGGGHR